MDVLQKILAERKLDVEKAKMLVPEKSLRVRAEARRHHSIQERFRDKAVRCIIAEVKKASPSAGLLMADYKPAELALGFQEAGAAAISVLTEPHYFLGSEADLCAVREAVDLPVLRKDFLCDVYQVYEAAAWGADLVLLIVAAIDRRSLSVLYTAARKAGLDVLIEAHTSEELRIALDFQDAIIGVNSRNLKTLKTDLSTAMELARLIPEGRMSVAESGIKEGADIHKLAKAGYRGFLVGEVLMKAGDPRGKLLEFSGCRLR